MNNVLLFTAVATDIDRFMHLSVAIQNTEH